MGLLSVSMLHEVKVPDIGDFTDVDVIEVLVQAGDPISEGQSLITLETDKATMEVPSPTAGVIRELKVAVGDRVSPGSLIALMEARDVAAPGASEPSMAGVVNHPAQPSPVLARVAEPPLASPAPSGVPAGPVVAAPSLASPRMPYASPGVRALARELGVSLEGVTGTGTKGRITRDDVRGFVRKAMAGPPAAQKASAIAGWMMPGLLAWPRVDFAKFGPVQRRDLSRIRRISGANLHRNWVMIPHVTNHEEADVTELEAFRAQINGEDQKSGVKVTMLAFLIKACVAALKRYPEFNASLDGEQIVLKGYYHIGFAAETPSGLVVPVLRDADKKGVLEIARETAALAAKAREGKLTPAAMSGGSFSISSLGGIGGTHFTPIINAPEVAILGAGRGVTRMAWNGREAAPRLVMPLSLSWDHRVIDGAAAGRFNAYLAQTLGDFRRVAL